MFTDEYLRSGNTNACSDELKSQILKTNAQLFTKSDMVTLKNLFTLFCEDLEFLKLQQKEIKECFKRHRYNSNFMPTVADIKKQLEIIRAEQEYLHKIKERPSLADVQKPLTQEQIAFRKSIINEIKMKCKKVENKRR